MSFQTSIRILFFLLTTLQLISCGDSLDSKKNFTGKYYLVETDTEDNLSICYRTYPGDYVGRVPPKVIDYAVIQDSLIIAKSLQHGSILFYVIKIRQDADYADEKDF